jgi:hypothetical protein
LRILWLGERATEIEEEALVKVEKTAQYPDQLSVEWKSHDLLFDSFASTLTNIIQDF